ncbi:pyridoxal-phosphate dependent enzyme [Solicola sp. PLA-1-18]|uniref:pyridoxal-phosphate dependent enzyme n=1 Tax=Solicola sp. PLA-1-18 TaxID=3380532 RepID=UPI003B7B4632
MTTHDPAEVFTNPEARTWRTPALTVDPWAFHRTLERYAPTPLRDLSEVARELGLGAVLVKDESDRLGLPAFKVLGASWAVHRAAAGDGPTGLVTATDGNHGRALARTGRLLGLAVRVFVPQGVHPAAIDAIESEGAGVVRTGTDYDRAVELAAADADATGALLVQDTAWAGYEQIPGWIVEGYTTLFQEVDEQLSGPPSLVVVPVGVGSLAQAALQHYRSIPSGSSTAVMSVEPTTAACVLTSLRAGDLTPVRTGRTIMAGLNCGTPSTAAWPFLRDGLDAATAVTDEAARVAADQLRDAGIDSGPCGAAALAGLRAALTGHDAADMRRRLSLTPESTVVLLSTEGAAANPALDVDDTSRPTARAADGRHAPTGPTR